MFPQQQPERVQQQLPHARTHARTGSCSGSVGTPEAHRVSSRTVGPAGRETARETDPGPGLSTASGTADTRKHARTGEGWVGCRGQEGSHHDAECACARARVCPLRVCGGNIQLP